MGRYFARCLRGLESIAKSEIAGFAGITHHNEDIRTLFFSYEGKPKQLLQLRSIDDIFFHLGEIDGLDHTRLSLTKIPNALAELELDLGNWIGQLNNFRKLSANPSYTLTAGLQGKKNFSRFELATAVLPVFEQQLHGEYVPNEAGTQGAELDFRLLLEGEKLQVGLRLSEQPLHRRPYKLHNQPGSTKPPLAYVMARLAEIKPEHVVLDPCCGVGTLLIEAGLAFPAKQYLGLDIQENSLVLAKSNSDQAGVEIQYQVGDVRIFLFAEASIDRIIVNPPWGRQVAEKEELPVLYQALFAHAAKVMKKGGLMVMLTDQDSWIHDNLALAFDLEKEIVLSLFGSLVKIYVLKKS